MAIAMGAMMYLHSLNTYGVQRLPDMTFYLALANGDKTVPTPYRLRVLMPMLFGTRPLAWQIANAAMFSASCGLVAAFGMTQGLTAWGALFAAFVWASFGGNRLGLMLPVLTDAAVTFFGIGAAVAFLTGNHAIGVGMLCVGTLANEKVPIVTAVAMWSLTPLWALFIVAALWFMPHTRKHWNVAWLDTPIRAAWDKHKAKAYDWRSYLMPWGVGLTALIGADVRTLVAFGIGYAALIAAQDTARVYQMCGAVVAVAAAGVIPESWMLPASVMHWFTAKHREF